MSAKPHAITIEGDRLDAPLLVPSSVFEHAGFRAWVKSPDFSDSVRATFVDGEVLIDMSPESLESHNKVKAAVTAALFDHVRQGDLGELYADRALVTHAEARLSCEPDLLFASWNSFEQGRLRLNARAGRKDEYIELEGTPDLVVEIISDTSVRKDEVLLRNAYHRAGVAEYWLIDARAEPLRLEILHHHAEGYRPAAPLAEPQESRVLGGRWLLTRTRNRLGRFAYRLESR